MKDKILKLIKEKSLKVGIFGLGYVGMPLLLQFASKGFEVIGFDIDENKISNLKKGNTMMKHIPNSLLENAMKTANVHFTTDYKDSSNCDALIICVPTPLKKHKEPDLSYIIKTVDGFSQYLRKGQVISLESTTYPGTTEEEIVARVESRGFIVGDDIFVLYSPEREDPGNKKFATHNIPKVCGGHTKNCSEVGKLLYGETLDDVVMVSSTKVAEMTKLLENIHRAVNIGLANEMKVICDKMDIDVYEVIDAAATKPFGFTPFYPGPGLGGHCIPIDPFYLTWKAREYGMHTRFIELSGEINEGMPAFVVSKLTDALNNQKRALNGSNILILGISYKKNIGDTREFPSVSIMSKLKSLGANVDYSDPYVKKFPKMKNYYFDLNSIDIDMKSLSNYDAVILATDHDDFNYELILKHSNILIDCRGKYRGKHKKVFQA